jgi:hypothetical protein
MKVNFYCFVRKIKLSDRIIYVVVAKMALKQTNILHFANGMMGCCSKNKYLMIMNLFTACEREAGVQLPPASSFYFLAYWCVIC